MKGETQSVLCFHLPNRINELTTMQHVHILIIRKQLKFQIKRIKEDVEYYIVSSLEPGYEENDYIYEDINGLDEIELSGVGLPSSATTDSNNSNDSPGSPTSILSGLLSFFLYFCVYLVFITSSNAKLRKD